MSYDLLLICRGVFRALLKSIYLNILISVLILIHQSVNFHHDVFQMLIHFSLFLHTGNEQCCRRTGQIYSITIQPDESIEAELIFVPGEVRSLDICSLLI